ncbi:NYN domain-containing protein [Patescibacteria group bacterium]|nr:NYN domain-containing protein [Patescibacteria group bacterium]
MNVSIRALGWRLDFKRFRIYLYEKYAITKAFIFIGYIPGNETLYTFLQSVGYICIFKPTLKVRGKRVKGNVDTELVLHAMIEYQNYDQAIIVSGDGDFFCLAEYLLKEGKLLRILIPNEHRYSSLLKRLNSTNKDALDFISRLKIQLEYKKRYSK